MFNRNYCLKITLQKILKNMKLKVTSTTIEKDYRNI